MNLELFVKLFLKKTWFSFCSVIFLSSRDRLVKKLEWKKTDA